MTPPSARVPVLTAVGSLRRLAIDMAPLIYFAEAHPVFGPTCAALFSLLAGSTPHTFVVSSLAYTETLIGPLRAGNVHLAAGYRRLLARTPRIETRPVTRAIAERAADLRARHDLPRPASASSRRPLSVIRSWLRPVRTFGGWRDAGGLWGISCT